MKLTVEALELKSIQYRRKVLAIIKKANAGHTGGSLSAIDILNVLYNRVLNVSPQNFMDANRDRYIQSKGHSVEALYVLLADQGFYPEAALDSLNQYQSHFIGHPTRKVNGIEQNTGSLGHGLPIAVGTAIAGKKDGRSFRVFTLLGDGELEEGSNWEASMSASHYGLDNLVAIVDYNQLQASGPIKERYDLGNIKAKFEVYGWKTWEIDGHNMAEIVNALDQTEQVKGSPCAIIAHTIKGKGVSFAENNYRFHNNSLSKEQYEQARKDIASIKV